MNSSRFPLLNHISSGILATDSNGTIQVWNSVLEAWHGESRELMEGKNLFELFPHLNSNTFRSELRQVFESNHKACFDSEQLNIIPCPLPDGALRALKVTITLLHEYQFALFTVEDRTEHQKMINNYREMTKALQSELDQKIKLEEQNSHLISAINQAAEAILISSAEGRIDYANRAFYDQTGWLEGDLDAMNIHQLLEENREDLNSPLNALFREGKTWQGRENIRCKDGSNFMASVSMAPIRDENRGITHAVIIQEDVSQQIAIDEKLRRSQKQEALITLVGGIAHDFNNLLAGLVGQVYLATREVQHMPATLNRMKKVQKISQDASEIVKQLLTFARQGDHKATEFPLDAFIKEFSKLARHSVPESISWSLDFNAGDYPFRGDANLLQQSLLNMVHNAVEACDREHSNSIELILSHLNPYEEPALLAKYPVLRHGNFAHIKIRDNGRGIASENLERVFDPFYTTKQLGSGLGLAIVMGCIRNHHGIIDIESQPGAGSTFHILLPLKRSQTVSASPAINDDLKANILLVDDDPNVLEPTKELLECMGHQVILAKDGVQACELFQTSSLKWDILITDMVMPRMNGLESAKKIRAIKPNIPIIFATGYDQALVIEGTRKMENAVLISKPFDPDDLERLVINMVKKSRLSS